MLPRYAEADPVFCTANIVAAVLLKPGGGENVEGNAAVVVSMSPYVPHEIGGGLSTGEL